MKTIIGDLQLFEALHDAMTDGIRGITSTPQQGNFWFVHTARSRLRATSIWPLTTRNTRGRVSLSGRALVNEEDGNWCNRRDQD